LWNETIDDEDDEVVGWENVCVVAVRTPVDDGVGSWRYLVVQRTSGKPSGGAFVVGYGVQDVVLGWFRAG